VQTVNVNKQPLTLVTKSANNEMQGKHTQFILHWHFLSVKGNSNSMP